MTQSIHIINGPNLNLIGQREPEIYGTENLNEVLEKILTQFPLFHIQLFQSNQEGAIVDYLQKILSTGQGIIINAGAYTHTSIAIRDALAIHKCPIIEVHISDIRKREEFRKQSYIHDLAWSVIMGYGINGYHIALQRMQEFLNT